MAEATEVVPQDTTAPVATDAGNNLVQADQAQAQQVATATPAAPEPVVDAAPPVVAEEGPKKTPWFMERIGELSRKGAEKDERLKTTEAELAVYKAMAEKQSGTASTDETPNPNATVTTGVPTQAEIREMVATEAAKIVAQQTYQQKAQTWLQNGKSEFKDFDDKCNVVAALGAGDKPEFMQIVTDLPDGHKIVAHMADNPEETQRILSLSPLSMAVEIAKMSATVSNKPIPKLAVSNAPAPARTVDGIAKTNDEISGDEDMKDFAAKWRKKEAAKKSNGYAKF